MRAKQEFTHEEKQNSAAELLHPRQRSVWAYNFKRDGCILCV